jgi:Dihydroorotase and related cyclic amidohydrolases
MADLTIRGAIVVTPNGQVTGGLSATDGVITHIGADQELPPATIVVDAAGKYLLPGLIDPHVHLGVGPGPASGTEKMERDFASESKDAASGGVTTMITTTLFGANSRGEVAEIAVAKGNEYSQVDYRLTSVITKREHLAEIPDLMKLGLRSFKFFLGYKGAQAEGFGMNTDGISWDFFYEACEALGAAGAKAFPTIHAEDPWVRDFLVERMRGSGSNALLQRWLETSPNILEPMQIYPAALIAHEVGTPVYVVHTSAWQSVDLIRDLRQRGWPIHGETLAAFLYWTAPEADAKNKGAIGKIQPPIRLDRDREALWAGLRDGTLTSVGTDCQMYPHSTRTQPDFWDTQVGLGPGMGTMLPAVYTSGVLAGRCTVDDIARLLSYNTAARFDMLPQKGQLAIGADADIIVFDPQAQKTVSQANSHTAAGYSLYDGETLTGWPSQTYVRGNLVFDSGDIVAPKPIGRHVPHP